ncbi:MAG: ABC transporter substrate-binding protein [Bacteroidota bacterium]
MKVVRDQMGNNVRLEKRPERIVSLVPSQTELLYDLGLHDEVVGITKFCIHPDEWFRSKKRVGGTKDVKIDEVRALEPDLIIGNKEENTKRDIAALESIAPVWMSDVYTLEDSFGMIRDVADICGRSEQGKQLVDEIQTAFQTLDDHTLKGKRVLYLIWKNPYMGVAKHTFIDHVLTRQLGFENLLGNRERYPAVELDAIDSPDIIMLSTEPFPFQEKHIATFESYFSNATIILVDGEYFSWYGSRLKDAPAYFHKLLEQLQKK